MKNLFLFIYLVSFQLLHASIANIKGNVKDAQGTAMPYVKVELLQNSQLIKSTATNTLGEYILYDIPAGIYDLQFKYIGYQNLKKSNIVVDSKNCLAINVSMAEQQKKLDQTIVISNLNNIPSTTRSKEIVSADVSASYGYYDAGKISTGTVACNKAPVYQWDEISKPTYVIDKDLEYQKDPISNNEDYSKINENKFIQSNVQAVSTFSIDVDNASYTNIRRMISYNQMPPKEAVRIEEMINYFKYKYPNPTGEDPFAVQTEMMNCPWNKSNKILMIGMQGKQLDYNQINPSNLVFLIDVSGSMSDQNKLPLVKESLKILLENLHVSDKIALVVYAGNAGLVLPSTEVRNKELIIKAIDNLQSGGSTAGGAGIKLAYKIAEENLIVGGNNRVVMCTDGDFNVGVSSNDEMQKLIETEREKKIFISMIGFGMGNYKDSKMETIADNGNGNYYYIDNINEATKVFKTDMKATLFTIAKDVKLQIYFNPDKIESYRLIGYENRVMAKEDFDNDKKDAGELGAGHTVTALYEVVIKGENIPLNRIDNNMSKVFAKEEIYFNNDDYLVLKMRYKKPDENTSKLLLNHLNNNNVLQNNTPSENIRFASSVALFGMLLRGSTYANNTTYLDVLSLAESAKGIDKEGYRNEFINMVKSTNILAKTHNNN